jgi:hypothetical protein
MARRPSVAIEFNLVCICNRIPGLDSNRLIRIRLAGQNPEGLRADRCSHAPFERMSIVVENLLPGEIGRAHV